MYYLLILRLQTKFLQETHCLPSILTSNSSDPRISMEYSNTRAKEVKLHRFCNILSAYLLSAQNLVSNHTSSHLSNTRSSRRLPKSTVYHLPNLQSSSIPSVPAPIRPSLPTPPVTQNSGKHESNPNSNPRLSTYPAPQYGDDGGIDDCLNGNTSSEGQMIACFLPYATGMLASR
jgi:hypothetical protein